MQGHDIRLGQVISNLLDNARSFSPADGTVRVDLSRDGRMIKITVDDDGPGIRAENTERIFERFYTDRPDGEGFGNNSGLGLSISRQIIEAHGGTIAATNRLEPKADGAENRRRALYHSSARRDRASERPAVHANCLLSAPGPC